MTDTAATLSIVKLFMNADPVVKGVFLLLLAASVWSWAVIIDKLSRLGAAEPSCTRARGAGRLGALGKQLELLKIAVPHAERIAVLVDPGNPSHAAGTSRATIAASTRRQAP